MASIAIGGFQHETNTFAPSPATYEDFLRPGAWPGLTRGEGLLEAVAGMNLPIAGFASEAGKKGHSLLPLSWSQATPSAAVTREAYETIVGDLLNDLVAYRGKGDLDAVYLDLHGAMVCEHHEDGEGELLSRVRELIGPTLPLVVSLDLHANVTPEMVEQADALIAFRTYPHVDMAVTGARAAKHMERLLLGQGPYHKAFRQLPFLMQLTAGCTQHEPGLGLYRHVAELEGGEVVSLSFACGFSPADIWHSGSSAVAYGKSQQAAEQAAQDLHDYVLAREAEFVTPVWSGEAAVKHAMAETVGNGPVILVDTQDNPGAGADSNEVGLLRELARQDAQGAAAAVLYDSDAAAAAHVTGEGARLSVTLGTRTVPERPPIAVDCFVERLSDGRFTATGPFYKGAHIELGPTALLAIGGVRVVVASRKMQAADQEIFRHLGIEPAEQKILALKSTAHFRAHFQPIAQDILIVAAGGPNPIDHTQLDYKRLRPGIRLMPLGPTFTP